MISHKQAFLQYVAQTSPEPIALEVVKANGMYLRTRDGKRYLDLISGIGVSTLGHRPQPVMQAIRKQLGKYMHTMVYGEHVQQPQVQLARTLSKLFPDPIDATFFVNSGSEAIEGAMKLAKRYTGRTKIVACNNAYHGSTHGALSLMSDPYFSNAYRPLLPNVDFIQFNNLSDVGQIDGETAAVFIEVVQGEGGYIKGDQEYLTAIRKRCTQVGALMVVDEIQTGLGRTGKLFAIEHFDIVPDIICLAKALGGGLPLGSFSASRDVMKCLSDNPVLGHITTFGGHPVSCASAIANLKIVTSKPYMGEVLEKEKIFRDNLKHKDIKEVTGLGLMLGVELSSDKRVLNVIQHLLKQNIITDWFLFAANKIRIAPPIIISKKEILKVCKAIKLALDETGD